MGAKLLWTGATFILALKLWNPLQVPVFEMVGAVFMIIGCVLMWLDK